MSSKSNLVSLAIAGAIALGCAGIPGCGDNPVPKNPEPNYAADYYKYLYTRDAEKNPSSFKKVKLDCVIEEVLPQSVPFRVNGYVPNQCDSRAANHPITYVLAKGKDNRDYKLIFPFPNVFRKGPATIEFFEVNGFICSHELLERFVGCFGRSDDNVSLDADGIICADGVKYREAGK